MDKILEILQNASVIFALASVLLIIIALIGEFTSKYVTFDLGIWQRFWAIVFGIAFGFAAVLHQLPFSDSDEPPVGTVIASYLPPQTFLSTPALRKQWILAENLWS